MEQGDEPRSLRRGLTSNWQAALTCGCRLYPISTDFRVMGTDRDYCNTTTGARQKAAFEVTGSMTETWQSYEPGASSRSEIAKVKGVIPKRVAPFGETEIGRVSSAVLSPEYSVTKASRGCARGAESGCAGL